MRLCCKKIISTAILFILLLCLGIGHPTFAQTTGCSDYEEFLKSEEKEVILESESQVLEELKTMLETEKIIHSASEVSKLPFENIAKVYVDTGLEEIDSAKREDVQAILEKSNYVWVVSMKIGDKCIQITYANQPSKGWKVTEMAIREIVPYHVTLLALTKEKAYTDYVLISGLPGFGMPVALAFENDMASAWINLGYENIYVEEVADKTESYQLEKENVEVYEYQSVLNAMKYQLEKQAENDESAGSSPVGVEGGWYPGKYSDSWWILTCVLLGVGVVYKIVYRIKNK